MVPAQVRDDRWGRSAYGGKQLFSKAKGAQSGVRSARCRRRPRPDTPGRFDDRLGVTTLAYAASIQHASNRSAAKLTFRCRVPDSDVPAHHYGRSTCAPKERNPNGQRYCADETVCPGHAIFWEHIGAGGGWRLNHVTTWAICSMLGYRHLAGKLFERPYQSLQAHIFIRWLFANRYFWPRQGQLRRTTNWDERSVAAR